MATAALTCLATSVGWCFCTASLSLVEACCGNDKPSTVPPSVTSGRRRSVLMVVLSIAMSLGYQYGLAPLFTTDSNVVTERANVSQKWGSGNCEGLEGSALEQCAGINGVFRVGFSTTVFFILAGIAVALKPTFNREVWPAKYILWVFFCAAMIFVPNEPLFSDVYLNVARVGAVLFVCFQQIMLVDMAHSWNDNWVTKSNQAEANEGPGAGQKWLYAILTACGILFGISIIALILLFVYFTGCPENNAIISLTLILGIGIVIATLSGEEGSLLSSAVIFTWAVFLCYTSVSKNPDASCNPTYEENSSSNLDIVLGIVVTVIGLGWTGWSSTAEDKLASAPSGDHPEQSQNGATPATTTGPSSGADVEQGSKTVTGIVTGTNDASGSPTASYTPAPNDNSPGANAETTDENDDQQNNDPRHLSNSWKLNAILAAVTCWMSMILTNFGIIDIGVGMVADPQVGRASLWVIASAQWLVLTIYLWTLVASRACPNRDFS